MPEPAWQSIRRSDAAQEMARDRAEDALAAQVETLLMRLQRQGDTAAQAADRVRAVVAAAIERAERPHAANARRR